MLTGGEPRQGSPLCSPRAGLSSPFPWPSPLRLAPSLPPPPHHRLALAGVSCLSNHREALPLVWSPALNSGPSGHHHLQTRAGFGRGSWQRRAAGRKGSPSPPPPPRTPSGAVVATSRREAEDRARAHAWETSGGGAGACAEGAARARVCVCARACWGAGWALLGARRLQPTSGSLSSLKLCLKTQVRHCGGARPALGRSRRPRGPPRAWSTSPLPAGALDAPGPSLQGARNPRFWNYLPSQVPGLADCPAGYSVVHPASTATTDRCDP